MQQSKYGNTIVNDEYVRNSFQLVIPDVAVIANTLILANGTFGVIYVDADATTQTLPDATTCKGRMFTIKLRVNAVSSVTVASLGGTVEGLVSYVITNIGGGILNELTFQSDGVNYNIIY